MKTPLLQLRNGTVRHPSLPLLALGLFVVLPGAWAQLPGQGSGTGISAALTKLFGDVSGFTAKAEAQLLDSSGQEVVWTPMEFAFRDNDIRLTLDLSEARNKNMPAGMSSALKQLGLARVVSISRPEKKLLYVLYPEQKMVLKSPMPQEQAEVAQKDARLVKTPVGNETLDGHPVVKNKCVLTDYKGEKVEATTWNATDLRDFPLKIQTLEKGSTSVVHFKQVELAKPQPGQFEIPEGFTQFDDPDKLREAILSKVQEKK